MDTSNTAMDLYSVWTSGPSAGYAVGEIFANQPRMVRNLSGTTWTPFDITNVYLSGIWGDGTGTVYAVGFGVAYKGQQSGAE
jgi:hypothetical protein